MAPTPYIKELFSIAIHLAKSLSERIPRSSTLQHECKQLATRLRTWRDKLPPDVEFLRSLTGDRDLYRAILSPLSELLCILCTSFPFSRIDLVPFAQPLTQHRPTHLDRRRTQQALLRRQNLPHHHLPHHRRRAEDRLRLPRPQKVPEEPRRLAEAAKGPRPARRPLRPRDETGRRALGVRGGRGERVRRRVPRQSVGGGQGVGEEGREGEGAARGVEVVGGEGDLKLFLFGLDWGSDFAERSLSLSGWGFG